MSTVVKTVTCTCPTISGMPRARSISCRAMTSAVLSRESSWSRSARSSLGPSLLARGPRSSSRGCPNCSLTQQMTQKILSHLYYFCTLLMQRSEEKPTANTDTINVCEFSFKSTERNESWDQCLPVCDRSWSVHSHGRIWPRGGLRWGPMSTKRAHTYTAFIVT